MYLSAKYPGFVAGGTILTRLLNGLFGNETPAPGNFARTLTVADMGLQGSISELKGTYSLSNGSAAMHIDMIEGLVKNPLKVVENMMTTARADGASSLTISGTLANERLYQVFVKRYGATTSNGVESITIPLGGGR